MLWGTFLQILMQLWLLNLPMSCGGMGTFTCIGSDPVLQWGNAVVWSSQHYLHHLGHPEHTPLTSIQQLQDRLLPSCIWWWTTLTLAWHSSHRNWSLTVEMVKFCPTGLRLVPLCIACYSYNMNIQQPYLSCPSFGWWWSICPRCERIKHWSCTQGIRWASFQAMSMLQDSS